MGEFFGEGEEVLLEGGVGVADGEHVLEAGEDGVEGCVVYCVGFG